MSSTAQPTSNASSSPLKKWGILLIRIPASIIVSILTLWIFGAIYYDGPGDSCSLINLSLALLWLVATLIIARKTNFAYWWGIRVLLCALPIWLLWLTIRPSNDRNWQAEFAQTGYVDIGKDQNTLTFHNVRNFDYVADGSPTGIVTERWETRTYHLDNLRGIDLFLDAFGGDLIAHPILSFDFGNEGHLCLSIETRRETSETYSTLGGLFKMFELQYIFGTESDLVRVRSNIRDEPIYLYRTQTTPEKARKLLMECIQYQNHLQKHPKWYNVITHNCTTSYRVQTPAKKKSHFDWRLLVNGKLDQMLYEKEALFSGGLSFKQLRKQAFINAAAEDCSKSDKFSEAIRKNRIGFSEKTP